MNNRPAYTVSLTINACRTDARFLGQTLRHMQRMMNYSFEERLIAYDAGPLEGRYRDQNHADNQQMRAILADLLTCGVIDRVDEVPWDDKTQRVVLKKYFNRDNVDLRDSGGTPIYQYLYALDRCVGDYVFHVDSDMLFHWTTERSWIDEAVEMMQANHRVVMAAPTSGPPQAGDWLERLCGRPIRDKSPTSWLLDGEIVSTRFFLLDRKRFEQDVMPLCQEKPGELLENSLAYTLGRRGRHIAWQMSSEKNWVIHPLTHGDTFVNHLADLIWAVENGVYPFRRAGFRWDMVTDGTNIRPWLWAIGRHDRISPSSEHGCRCRQTDESSTLDLARQRSNILFLLFSVDSDIWQASLPPRRTFYISFSTEQRPRLVGGAGELFAPVVATKVVMLAAGSIEPDFLDSTPKYLAVGQGLTWPR